MSRHEREIEAFFTERLGRPCLFLPSGRLAVYAALPAYPEPGARILLSPLNDDVIFFIALAAGLRPVIAPVSPDDGNIDPAQVPEDVWTGLGAVLTTNLYGLPDRVEDLRARCDRLGIPLIEDASRALHTRVGGRLIGTFGTAAAFSLSKHLRAHAGGVLAFSDEAERRGMERLTAAMVREAAWGDRVRTLGNAAAEDLVVALRLAWPARWLRRRLKLVERSGYRMPLQHTKLRAALAGVPDLDAFHTWIRVDRHEYGNPPSSLVLAQALRRLRRLEADSAARVEGVRRLRHLAVAAPAVRAGDPQPLFRVPLLVNDRAAVITSLERRVHGIGYIYDPPLDDYAARSSRSRARTAAPPGPSPHELSRWIPSKPAASCPCLRRASTAGAATGPAPDSRRRAGSGGRRARGATHAVETARAVRRRREPVGRVSPSAATAHLPDARRRGPVCGTMAVVRALRIRATGRALAPMAAVLAIVGLDRIIALRNWPVPVVGLLDEPAHLLTAWVLLAAVGVTPSRVVRWVFLGAVAIDVDHIPLYLWGAPVAGDGGRPVTHSLTTVAALLLVAVTVPRSRTVVSALTAGLVLHLTRDIVTGPGIPLLWPIRPDSVLLPYPACLALLTAAACWAVVRRSLEERRRRATGVLRPT